MERPRTLFREPLLRDPAFFVLLLTGLFVAQAANHFAKLYHFNVVDDAYISFNYAKNLVLGRGLVFNPGEFVEGYTNFLWVIVLAPLWAITNALSVDFTRTAIALNIVIALADLTLVYAIARRLFRQAWVPTSLVLVLCALDNSYQGYAMSGLENHLLILCLLGAVLVWIQQPRRTWLWVALLLALTTMTRPDGGLAIAAFLFSGVFGLILPRWGPRKNEKCLSRKQIAAQLALTAAAFALLYGAYFLWRYQYYGALLPNTFYLKVGGEIDAIGRGLKYTYAFFDDRFFIPAAALVSVLWVGNAVVRWLLLYSLMHFAYVTYVGGDFYSGQRFYVVLLPILYLLIGWVVHRPVHRIEHAKVWRWIRRYPLLAAGVIAVPLGVFSNLLYLFAQRGYRRGPYTNEIMKFDWPVNNNIKYMKWFGTFAKPGSSMALGDIGCAGFLSDVRVVDVFGVVDPNIAHMKVANFGRGKAGHEKRGSRKYLLDLKPTYVKWGYIPGDLRRDGYYIFTEFPPGFRTDGLWIREDRGPGRVIPGTAIHFTSSELAFWNASGNAFASFPTGRPVKGMNRVFGQTGTYINSFVSNIGDRATGRLLSPRFPLVGELMFLQVGGGRDAERLRVSLLIDGKREFSATGHDFETLGRRTWNIEPFKGKQARLEIVDYATGMWGHILVDEVVQWESKAK